MFQPPTRETKADERKKNEKKKGLGDPEPKAKPEEKKGKEGKNKIGPNDKCPCGSGKKYASVL